MFPGSALRYGRTALPGKFLLTDFSRDVEPEVSLTGCTRLLSVRSGFVFVVFPQTNIVYLSRGRERTVNIKEAERARVRSVLTHCVSDEARAARGHLCSSFWVQLLRTTETFSLTDRQEGPETSGMWEDGCPCLLLPLPIQPVSVQTVSRDRGGRG